MSHHNTDALNAAVWQKIMHSVEFLYGYVMEKLLSCLQGQMNSIFNLTPQSSVTDPLESRILTDMYFRKTAVPTV